MKTTLDSIQARESQYVLHTYRRQPVAFVRGKGPRLYDVDGREYLDFVSGIGVASLGHAHPGLAADRQTPLDGTAEQDRLRPQCQGLQHMGAPPHTPIDEHLDPAGDRFDDGR